MNVITVEKKKITKKKKRKTAKDDQLSKEQKRINRKN